MIYTSVILDWARNKGLLDPENILRQHSKLEEEVAELLEAIQEGDTQEIKLELGDCLVVLTILAEQAGLTLNWCMESAYDKIKNRTGKTVNGKFIKDA